MSEWVLAGVTFIAVLIGVVYRIVIGKIEKIDKDKVDKELYLETIGHIEKAVAGINGTASQLKTLAEGIANIQDKFMTRKDFLYEMKIHRLGCPFNKDETESQDKGCVD